MDKKEILLKAFEIMLENHNKELDFCTEIDKCEECPFCTWEVCPNLIKENEFEED